MINNTEPLTNQSIFSIKYKAGSSSAETIRASSSLLSRDGILTKPIIKIFHHFDNGFV